MTSGAAGAVAGAPPGRWPALGRSGMMALAVAVLALCAAVELRTCLKLIRVDQADLVGEEYNNVFALQRLMREGTLYGDPTRPPYAVVQYGPLSYLIALASARIAGLAVDDAPGLTRLMRSVSFACLLGQVAAVGLILRRHLRASWSAVIVAGAAVLTLQVPWCLSARPDSLETLLVIVATLLGLESGRAATAGGRPTAWLTASLVCGTAAILAKQSGFVAGLIVLPPALALLGVRRTLAACALAAIPSALLAAATLLPLGPAVRANVIGGVDNGLSPRAAIQVTYMPYLRAMAAPAAAAILAAFSLLSRRRAGDPAPGREGGAAASLAWGALVSVALATLLALKYGSSVNYYNIFNLFALILLLGVVAIGRAGLPGGWGPFVALYLILYIPAKAYDDLNASIKTPRPYGECAEVARRLRERLGEGPDGPRFFSQDPRLDCLIPDRAAAPGKLVNAILYRRGVVDFSDFARAVRDGEVRYCVTFDDRAGPAELKESFDRFAVAHTLAPDPDRPAFLGASFEGFRPLFRVGPHVVFESPQNGNRTGSSELGRRSPYGLRPDRLRGTATR